MSNKKALIARCTLPELVALRGAKCERCGRTEWLTIDHIVPVQILKQMGLSVEEMYSDMDLLKILCRPCNSLKNCQLDFADKRTKEILLKYLNRL